MQLPSLFLLSLVSSIRFKDLKPSKLIYHERLGNFSPSTINEKIIVSNKKASIIAVIPVIVGFFIYDQFKPLSEEKIIAKQGLATVYLDNSYKNIDSTHSPEGTLLAQHSQRHNMTVVITGGHLTGEEIALSFEDYAKYLQENAPKGSTFTILNSHPENEELIYSLSMPDRPYSWQRLQRNKDTMTVISVVSDSENPKVDPITILQEAEFGTH